MDARREVDVGLFMDAIFVVGCRIFCDKMVGATYSESFLVSHVVKRCRYSSENNDEGVVLCYSNRRPGNTSTAMMSRLVGILCLILTLQTCLCK